MFAGVLVAAVLHGALLIVFHKLLDLRFEDYTRPLTVQLLAPESRAAPVRAARPLPPKQEETAPAVAVPKPAPQPVATPRPAARTQPAPERATAQEPAPVRTQPRTESAPTEAPASTVAAWTPALRQSVESAPVRGRGGLNAVPGDAATQAGPPAGAATGAPASFAGQGDLPTTFKPTTFKDGLTLPVDESVFTRSASSQPPGSSAAQGVGSDDSVPVVRDLGQSGTNRDVAAPRTVRMSGTPRRADVSGTGTGGAVLATLPADSASLPAGNKQAPAHATTVSGGTAPPSRDAEGIGSENLDRLDQALDASGLDSTASTGADRGASTAADGAAGPPGPDVRLPEGWKVLGSLGLRELQHVVPPELPKGYPDESVGETVRVQISANPQGLVKVESFEQASVSAELNSAITVALRQWRYERVHQSQGLVYGVVEIQIRIRSTEVAVSGQ